VNEVEANEHDHNAEEQESNQLWRNHAKVSSEARRMPKFRLKGSSGRRNSRAAPICQPADPTGAGSAAKVRTKYSQASMWLKVNPTLFGSGKLSGLSGLLRDGRFPERTGSMHHLLTLNIAARHRQGPAAFFLGWQTWVEKPVE
jgi:hypothetical protein